MFDGRAAGVFSHSCRNIYKIQKQMESYWEVEEGIKTGKQLSSGAKERRVHVAWYASDALARSPML